MASVISPVHSPIRTCQFSSLYLSCNKISPSFALLKARSLSSKASSLTFSPLPETIKPFSPVEPSGKALRFSGWSQELRRRGSVEPPVAKAAAADAEGAEIESAAGLDLLIFSFYFLFSMKFRNFLILWLVAEKWRERKGKKKKKTLVIELLLKGPVFYWLLLNF